VALVNIALAWLPSGKFQVGLAALEILHIGGLEFIDIQKYSATNLFFSNVERNASNRFIHDFIHDADVSVKHISNGKCLLS